MNPTTHFFVNGADLRLNTEFFPLAVSPNKSTEAAVSIALPERGVPWFVDLKELMEENKDNPHFDLGEAIKTKANAVAAKGATALIIYNTSATPDNLNFNGKDREPACDNTHFVCYCRCKEKISRRSAATLDIKLKTDIGDKKRTGNNVVGYIDNGAATTIILGAHYDHLGYGEDGNSMLRGTTDKQIS